MSYPGYIRWWRVRDDLMRPVGWVRDKMKKPSLSILPRSSITLAQAMPIMREVMDKTVADISRQEVPWLKRYGGGE